MPEFRVEVVDSVDGIRTMREAWNSLLGIAGAKSVFLTCDWLCTWAQTYATGGGCSPHVLTVWSDKDLLAIAPWVMRQEKFGPFRLRSLAFLGTPETSSDYLDVIVRAGKEKDVAAAIYRHLFETARSCWDRLQFVDVPCDSTFFLWFLNLLEEGGRHYDSSVGSFCPVAFLPENRDSFFRELTVTGRQQFNRHSKLLSQRGKVEHVRTTGNAAVETLGSFMDLYSRRWAISDDRFQSFLKAYTDCVAEEGIVRIDLLKVDSLVIAGLLHLRSGDTESMYLMAIDRDFEPGISIGNIIVGICIGRAIEEGVKTYDFLKGMEPYKFRWARNGKRLMDVRVHSRAPGSFLYFTWQTIKSLGKVVLR